ncbi:hypothetical protein E4U45_006145 [Claviceps purpurea]|nr:hypothetical protein E4U45_006145 [Claviceps purpurea]
MDNTYKVNRFNMPLMQVIGVSAMATNFSVAFGLAAREDTDAYMWFLQQLRSAQESARIRAPEWIGSLDGCEIVEGKGAKKAKKAKKAEEPRPLNQAELDDEIEPGQCKELTAEEEEEDRRAGELATQALNSTPPSSVSNTADGIRDAWLAVMRAPTETQFLENWKKLRETFPEQTGKYEVYPVSYGTLMLIFCLEIIDYLETTYVAWREQFADFAVKEYLNFGVTVTSRVESTHHELKARLKHRYIDLYELQAAIWDMIQTRKVQFALDFDNAISVRKVLWDDYPIVQNIVRRVGKKS